MSMQDLIAAARTSKAWPFQEAQKLLKRYPDGAKPDGSPILFLVLFLLFTVVATSEATSVHRFPVIRATVMLSEGLAREA